MLTRTEAIVLRHAANAHGVKCWNNQCWIGHEWHNKPIKGAGADVKDSLLAQGFLQRKDGWQTLYEATETGRQVLGANGGMTS